MDLKAYYYEDGNIPKLTYRFSELCIRISTGFFIKAKLTLNFLGNSRAPEYPNNSYIYRTVGKHALPFSNLKQFKDAFLLSLFSTIFMNFILQFYCCPLKVICLLLSSNF